MTGPDEHHVDKTTVALLMVILALVAVGYVDRRQNLIRDCRNIEMLKTTLREPAEATVAGDKLLLESHDKHGEPLPVPRAAVLADIAAKQRVVDRTQPRKC